MQKIALSILLCFAFFIAPNYAQSPVSDPATIGYVKLVGKEYGLNHELINGVQYFNRYSRSQGHPYFLSWRCGSTRTLTLHPFTCLP
jgi:hypothetical protein